MFGSRVAVFGSSSSVFGSSSSVFGSRISVFGSTFGTNSCAFGSSSPNSRCAWGSNELLRLMALASAFSDFDLGVPANGNLENATTSIFLVLKNNTKSIGFCPWLRNATKIVCLPSAQK